MDELRPDKVAQHLLQMLPVFLIDTEKKKGQHQSDHQQNRRVVSDAAPCEDISGNPHQRAAAEAYQLALREIERHFRFYFRQVLRDWHKRHYLASLSLDFAGGVSCCSIFPAASWARMEGLRSSESISNFSEAREQKSWIALSLLSW